MNHAQLGQVARRLSDQRRVATDVVLATVLAAASVPEAAGPHNQAPLLGYLAVACATLPLVARRRWPALVLAVVVGGGSMLVGLGIPPPALLGAGFAIYTLAATSRTVLPYWAVAGSLTPMLIAGVIAANTESLHEPRHDPLQAVGLPVVLGCGSILVGWLAGENVRARHSHAQALAERVAAREREHAKRTAAEERARIARELHDEVAHAMSVIAVRSGVARKIGNSRPETATEALSIIETISRRSLSELRRIVAVLRNPDEPGTAQLSPAPGLGDLPHLVDQIAAAGVRVDIRVDGDACPLPPTEDLCAYRIVQEALTNVVRHSAARSANLWVRYQPGALEIECIDPGGQNHHAAGAELSNGGHGLVGMRERVALYGGHFSAGPTSEGFRVLARIPIPEDAR